MQLSVSRYQAIAFGRGTNLDSIDFALNDRFWLKNEFAKIEEAPRDQQAAMTDLIVNWTNPGGRLGSVMTSADQLVVWRKIWLTLAAFPIF